MALINASSFGNLAAVSVNANAVKIPVKFFNVSISGKRRGKINSGYLQCPVGFSEDGNGDFIILNADDVYFIPLYIKKYWAKYMKQQSKDGKDSYEVCCAFGWDEKSPKIDGAKTEYIIAGYLWDNVKKNIVKHEKDLEDNEIKAGEPVLIYFRCKGSKCNCAYELVKKVNDAAKNLNPLSDDATFEQNVINPRRFLIRTTITQKDSAYGPFDVFKFDVAQTLPDDLVMKILDAANNKFLKDFNKQFDKTEFVVSKKEASDMESTAQSYTKSAAVDHIDVPDVENVDSNPGDDFNIDI